MNVAWWCSAAPGQVWTWRYTPFLGVWVLAGSLIGGYLAAHRRAGQALDRRRARSWLLGVLAFVLVSEWPVGAIGVGYLASVAVGRYVVITFVVAPLLLRGIPTWLLDRWLPHGSRRARVVAVATSWPMALLVFNVVLFTTHAPVVIDTFKVSQLGSFTVDGLHIVAALLWWWPAIRREPDRGALQEPVRAFYLFGSSVLMFVPAAFLTFSPYPLYGLYELAPPLWLGFDPLMDQQAAGIIMQLAGGLMLWAIIAALFLGWARREQADDWAALRARDARTLARMRELEAERDV